MPIYEYVCSNCNLSFEELLKVSELDKVVPCPKCNSKKTERKISGFSTMGTEFDSSSSCNTGFG